MQKASFKTHNIELGNKMGPWKESFKLSPKEEESWRMYSDSFKRTDEAAILLKTFGIQGLHSQTFATARQRLKERSENTGGGSASRAAESEAALSALDNITSGKLTQR